ncbi:MAG TPA: DUF3177 domain-containing protein [Cyanobacteria bacterium UBA11149]|nr:DUF3177 domain-containing protein [Cyanobacteria bacterium UBA11367]HBE56640.1 DUF3177 domain-containing protein [Cyanobacteria bacterium UBA11366]HBK65154.1 DUF3177 domain-containing protein [Cyanobacteria bacterium UBA11166]HBR74782.1 DUF3177 domain-containing protein [Cyanobacteria bacterium UBA11159]HBS70028.1 DUF3177 domain-containing protein [Cyanobacteria bacterium UBA11153]HBW92004.1 DUF3177 domain-containing protein [Cyanobacteria bacterium UBA11149]HCA95911.1 DUF3177 domain-conta
MSDTILRAIVWTDYRIAVLFGVFIPLSLLIWAFVEKADAMLRLMIVYWRVASLLAFSVYILIASWPIGFISGILARFLIPVSLWFWVDVNEDIDDRPASPLKLTLTAWRWAMTVYCTLGFLWSLTFVRCGFARGAIQENSCQVWLEAPSLFKEYFHHNSKPEFLGFLGMVGLVIYVLYLGYFVLIRLGKQGRSAMEQ